MATGGADKVVKVWSWRLPQGGCGLVLRPHPQGERVYILRLISYSEPKDSGLCHQSLCFCGWGLDRRLSWQGSNSCDAKSEEAYVAK